MKATKIIFGLLIILGIINMCIILNINYFYNCKENTYKEDIYLYKGKFDSDAQAFINTAPINRCDTGYFWMMKMRNRAYYSADSLYHLYVDSTWNFTNNMTQIKNDSLTEIMEEIYGPLLK